MSQSYRSRQQWFQIIEQFNDSNMNVATFCRSRQISQASFYQWRKKLTEQTPSTDTEPLFIDITPPAGKPELDTPAWDIELSLGQGMVLRIRKPC